MKTVLITGISRGIGKALKNKFSEEGFDVIGTILDNSNIENTQNLNTIKLDLSSSESINTCSKQISLLGKKIDILINNSGVLLDEDNTSVIIDKLKNTLNINLIGTIDFTEHILPFIKFDGHIINISSTAGSLARVARLESHFPNHYPSYKISKAALNMYTCTLALRLKDSGIIVSSVHPGWVKTDMGGKDANVTPEQAADNIYKLAISRPESGQFWFNGEKLEW